MSEENTGSAVEAPSQIETAEAKSSDNSEFTLGLLDRVFGFFEKMNKPYMEFSKPDVSEVLKEEPVTQKVDDKVEEIKEETKMETETKPVEKEQEQAEVTADLDLEDKSGNIESREELPVPTPESARKKQRSKRELYLEIYNQNPRKAASYFEKNSAEILKDFTFI